MDKGEIADSKYQEAVKGLNKNILEDKDLWYSYVINLPISLQIIYTLGILNQQVLNGGLHQYFFNAYGQFAYITIDNLELIKAYRTANILKRALNKVNEEQYSMDEFREKVFSRKLERIVNFDDELGDFLDELDKEYDLLDEDLVQLYVDYLKK